MRPISETITCEQASSFYYDYIQHTAASSIGPDIQSHIENCKFCQREIKRLKTVLAESAEPSGTNNIGQKNTQIATALASHFNLVNREITCEIAKRFMPSLADASLDIRISTPITVHIEKCDPCKRDLDTIRGLKLTPNQLTCLERVFVNQIKANHKDCELHREIINSSATSEFDNNDLSVLTHILKRQESGITTEYLTKRPSGNSALADYKNWPVEIKVHNRVKETAIAAEDAYSRIDNYNRIKRLIMPLATAAAVVLVAVWFFVGTSAKAIKYDDIYGAVGKIQNICLMTGTHREDKTVQKAWISKDLNIQLLYSADSWILWDIQNKVRKSHITGTELSSTDKLSDAETENLRQTMDILQYVLPFQNPYSLPDKYNWKSLPDTAAAKQLNNSEVYDLLWSDSSANNSSVYYRWRVYIDKDTMLPKRVENWQKRSSAEEYELKSWTDITYPQTSEIETVLDEAGFTQK